MDKDLCDLARTAVFLFDEFFQSGIEPLAARVRLLRTEDSRRDFYVKLLPSLIAHVNEIGLPRPYETALTLVRIVMFRANDPTGCLDPPQPSLPTLG